MAVGRHVARHVRARLEAETLRYICKYNEAPKPVKWKYCDLSRRITPDSTLRPLIRQLAYAKMVIEAWRREYNEERPKKSGWADARTLAKKSATLSSDSKAECY